MTLKVKKIEDLDRGEEREILSSREEENGKALNVRKKHVNSIENREERKDRTKN